MTRESDPRVAVVIVAAGSGTRAGGGVPKQFQPIGGRPLLAWTLQRFLDHPGIDRIVTVIHPDHAGDYQHAIAACQGDLSRLAPPVAGGATRQSSVHAGLQALEIEAPDLVLIHDAARPYLSGAILDRTISGLARGPAVLVAMPVVDTVKRGDAVGLVTETLSRDGLWTAQTPQGFRFEAILAAHRAAAEAGRADFTDDAAVAEWAGLPVSLVPGEATNIKITTSADLAAADRKAMMDQALLLSDIRVGTGYDVHSFVPGDTVVLAGVRIPHSAKLNGHSDSDVALHALTDALLGAIGDGDIGQHFPPSNETWRGADSALFVRDALARIRARGGVVAHVDISLSAEAPKIGPHREAMRDRVAESLDISRDRVGIKATTNEKLGFIGRGEGIAAIATATVRLPFDPHGDM